MSLTITTLDGRAGADQTYALLSQSESGTRRLDTASTPAEPKSLVIKHSVAGSGLNAIDRHLIQVSTTKLDTAGVPRVGIVNLTMSVPRNTAITQTMIEDALANIVNLVCAGAFSTTTGFASNSVITQILRGES